MFSESVERKWGILKARNGIKGIQVHGNLRAGMNCNPVRLDVPKPRGTERWDRFVKRTQVSQESIREERGLRNKGRCLGETDFCTRGRGGTGCPPEDWLCLE